MQNGFSTALSRLMRLHPAGDVRAARVGEKAESVVKGFSGDAFAAWQRGAAV